MSAESNEVKAVSASRVKRCIGSDADRLHALHSGADPRVVVPILLDILQRDPLASAGYFRGDILRALIELPSDFWRHEPSLFKLYQSVVRAGAIARRALPSSERMAFWTNEMR